MISKCAALFQDPRSITLYSKTGTALSFALLLLVAILADISNFGQTDAILFQNKLEVFKTTLSEVQLFEL